MPRQHLPLAHGRRRVPRRAESRRHRQSRPHGLRGLGDWHVNAPPDARAVEAAKRRGYDLSALRGRKVSKEDFTRFDWILCMDESNLKVLSEMKPDDFAGHLGLLLDFAPEQGLREVPDPYFGGPEGFDRVLDLIEASAAGLVARLQPLVERS
jgi:protein-tyrosine phosphatase